MIRVEFGTTFMYDGCLRYFRRDWKSKFLPPLPCYCLLSTVFVLKRLIWGIGSFKYYAVKRE
jgi:hypothetical protein